VHLAKFTPFLPHFNKNCLEIFFHRPGGAPAPPAPPGYACDYEGYEAQLFALRIRLIQYMRPFSIEVYCTAASHSQNQKKPPQRPSRRCGDGGFTLSGGIIPALWSS